MPKSADNSETSNNNKSNPYITKGISKKFLTPCRQVGLSRKRKTPSSIEKTLDIVKSISQDFTQVQTDSTSMTSKEVPVDNASESIKPKTKRNKLHPEKKSVSKCLIASDKTDHNSLEVACLNEWNSTDFTAEAKDKGTSSMEKKKLEEKVNKNVKSSLIKQESQDKPLKENLQTKNKLKDNKGSLLEKNIKNSETIKEASSEIKHEKSKEKKLEPLTQRDEVTINMPVIQDKTLKENLLIKNKSKDNKSSLLKQSIPDNKTVQEVVSEIKLEKSIEKIIKTEAKINATREKTSEKNLQKSENSNKQDVAQFTESGENPKHIDPPLDHPYTKSEKKNKKIKRSLSMKKSSEEYENRTSPSTNNFTLKECSVLLNKNDSVVRDNLLKISENEIDKLEKKVKEKQKLVEELAQAEIYKKRHNVNTLKELTTTWKTGCISALNDLLPQLQTHGDTDMAMLLNNLRVPESLIKLSESGDLI